MIWMIRNWPDKRVRSLWKSVKADVFKEWRKPVWLQGVGHRKERKPQSFQKLLLLNFQTLVLRKRSHSDICWLLCIYCKSIFHNRRTTSVTYFFEGYNNNLEKKHQAFFLLCILAITQETVNSCYLHAICLHSVSQICICGVICLPLYKFTKVYIEITNIKVEQACVFIFY